MKPVSAEELERRLADADARPPSAQRAIAAYTNPNGGAIDVFVYCDAYLLELRFVGNVWQASREWDAGKSEALIRNPSASLWRDRGWPDVRELCVALQPWLEEEYGTVWEAAIASAALRDLCMYVWDQLYSMGTSLHYARIMAAEQTGSYFKEEVTTWD